MRIVAGKTLERFARKHRSAASALRAWLHEAKHAHWQSIEDVRRTYPHADMAKVRSGATVTIFNIKGNAYRLVVAIHYRTGVIFIRDFLTHAQYSKNDWKDRH